MTKELLELASISTRLPIKLPTRLLTEPSSALASSSVHIDHLVLV